MGAENQKQKKKAKNFQNYETTYKESTCSKQLKLKKKKEKEKIIREMNLVAIYNLQINLSSCITSDHYRCFSSDCHANLLGTKNVLRKIFGK